MTNCFLEGFGTCSEKVSREHYVSATILRSIAPEGGLAVGGLAWQKDPATLQGIGIGSLQSKILCQKHNSILSAYDEEASKFFKHLLALDKEPNDVPASTSLDGEKTQRWMLKTLIATTEAGGLNSNLLSPRHKKILLGTCWPSRWGLHASKPSTPQVFTQDLYLETQCNPMTGDLIAGMFRLAGIEFWLVISKVDDPKAYGLYRPRGLVFWTGTRELHLEMRWLGPQRKKSLTFFKIGESDSNLAPPPHQLS